jgi:hypothetical protein
VGAAGRDETRATWCADRSGGGGGDVAAALVGNHGPIPPRRATRRSARVAAARESAQISARLHSKPRATRTGCGRSCRRSAWSSRKLAGSSLRFRGCVKAACIHADAVRSVATDPLDRVGDSRLFCGDHRQRRKIRRTLVRGGRCLLGRTARPARTQGQAASPRSTRHVRQRTGLSSMRARASPRSSCTSAIPKGSHRQALVLAVGVWHSWTLLEARLIDVPGRRFTNGH